MSRYDFYDQKGSHSVFKNHRHQYTDNSPPSSPNNLRRNIKNIQRKNQLKNSQSNYELQQSKSICLSRSLSRASISKSQLGRLETKKALDEE